MKKLLSLSAVLLLSSAIMAQQSPNVGLTEVHVLPSMENPSSTNTIKSKDKNIILYLLKHINSIGISTFMRNSHGGQFDKYCSRNFIGVVSLSGKVYTFDEEDFKGSEDEYQYPQGTILPFTLSMAANGQYYFSTSILSIDTNNYENPYRITMKLLSLKYDQGFSLDNIKSTTFNFADIKFGINANKNIFPYVQYGLGYQIKQIDYISNDPLTLEGVFLGSSLGVKFTNRLQNNNGKFESDFKINYQAQSWDGATLNQKKWAKYFDPSQNPEQLIKVADKNQYKDNIESLYLRANFSFTKYLKNKSNKNPKELGFKLDINIPVYDYYQQPGKEKLDFSKEGQLLNAGISLKF